jgi:hypothetical protein
VIRGLLLSVILLLGAVSLQAQWLGTFAIESGYDDNMFRNYSAAEAALTDFTLMYGYFPEDRNWALNYSGGLTSFAQYAERLYSTHSLGASWATPYGEDEANSLTILGSASLRLDGVEYELYDYSQLAATASVKQRLLDELPLLASYRLRYRNYPNFGELSYLEHFASLGSSMYFESNTSIRIQADFGFKNYLSSAGYTPAPAISGFTSSGSMTVDGGGYGSGVGSGGGGGSGTGRMGMGGQGSGMERSVQYLMYEEPSTSQLSAWMNVGQGITETTGLSLRLLQRWNLTDRGRAFIGGAIDFIGEEELFDDPYSYESSEATLTLTQLLGWGMKMKMGGYYLLKTYGYPASLDYSDPAAASRQDDRMGGWLTLEKSLTGSWLLFSGLDLTVSYIYLRNQSNTAYYDYSSNSISLGISTDF